MRLMLMVTMLLQVTRIVNVVDTVVPVITLSGSSPVTVEVGSVYTDAGATAFDNYDGVLTGSIVVVNSVNTAVVGVLYGDLQCQRFQ